MLVSYYVFTPIYNTFPYNIREMKEFICEKIYQLTNLFFVIDKKKIYLAFVSNQLPFFSLITLFFLLSLCLALYARENMSFYQRSFVYLNTIICLRREIALTKLMTSSFSNPFSRRSISMSADSSETR